MVVLTTALLCVKLEENEEDELNLSVRGIGVFQSTMGTNELKVETGTSNQLNLTIPVGEAKSIVLIIIFPSFRLHINPLSCGRLSLCGGV